MKTKLCTFAVAVVISAAVLFLAHSAAAQSRAGGAQYQAKPPASNPASASQAAAAGKTEKGSGGADVAQQITPDEAKKKYPMKGNYPTGERDAHKPSGVVNSPYPPHVEYDCSNVPHGGLVLDTRVNKVFIRP